MRIIVTVSVNKLNVWNFISYSLTYSLVSVEIRFPSPSVCNMAQWLCDKTDVTCVLLTCSEESRRCDIALVSFSVLLKVSVLSVMGCTLGPLSLWHVWAGGCVTAYWGLLGNPRDTMYGYVLYLSSSSPTPFRCSRNILAFLGETFCPSPKIALPTSPTLTFPLDYDLHDDICQSISWKMRTPWNFQDFDLRSLKLGS